MVRKVIGDTVWGGIIELYFLNSRWTGGQWNWQHLNQRAVTHCLISYQIFRVFQDELEYDFTEMRTNKVRNFHNCSLATPLALLEFSNWTPYLCNIQSVQHVNCNKLILLFESTRCTAELLNALIIPCSLLFWLLYVFACLPSFLMVDKDIHTYTSLLESQHITEGITSTFEHDSPKHVVMAPLPSFFLCSVFCCVFFI